MQCNPRCSNLAGAGRQLGNWGLIASTAHWSDALTSTSRFYPGRTWKFWKNHGFPIRATINAKSKEEKEGKDRRPWFFRFAVGLCQKSLVLDQAARRKERHRLFNLKENHHCPERKWNPIRKGFVSSISESKNKPSCIISVFFLFWFQPLPPCSNQPTYSFRRRPPEVLQPNPTFLHFLQPCGENKAP